MPIPLLNNSAAKSLKATMKVDWQKLADASGVDIILRLPGASGGTIYHPGQLQSSYVRAISTGEASDLIRNIAIETRPRSNFEETFLYVWWVLEKTSTFKLIAMGPSMWGAEVSDSKFGIDERGEGTTPEEALTKLTDSLIAWAEKKHARD